jgi:hypothetical protein
MRGLSARELLELWERGMESSEIERGLLMLSYCLPERPWAQLAAVSIGRRDSMLLELRRATLGTALNAFAVCPGCAEELEFEMNAEELGLSSGGEEQAEEHSFQQGPFSVHCRLPDSTDLYAASSCASVEEARQMILSRCIHSIEAVPEFVEQAPAAGEIPEAVAEGFEAYLSERESAADVSLKLECPSCGQRWELALDIVSFFWREIQSVARRIVLEVDALARSYGWGEAEILSMTPARRQLYLEMVG